jgi:hypothetical protein
VLAVSALATFLKQLPPMMLMDEAEINRKAEHVFSDPPISIFPGNRPMFKSGSQAQLV